MGGTVIATGRTSSDFNSAETYGKYAKILCLISFKYGNYLYICLSAVVK